MYMAHVGSFVPAQRCVVGITDKILTRLVSQEQLALHQSSFMADIAQVCDGGLWWAGGSGIGQGCCGCRHCLY